jgi:hypothetical protein
MFSTRRIVPSRRGPPPRSNLAALVCHGVREAHVHAIGTTTYCHLRQICSRSAGQEHAGGNRGEAAERAVAVVVGGPHEPQGLAIFLLVRSRDRPTFQRLSTIKGLLPSTPPYTWLRLTERIRPGFGFGRARRSFVSSAALPVRGLKPVSDGSVRARRRSSASGRKLLSEPEFNPRIIGISRVRIPVSASPTRCWSSACSRIDFSCSGPLQKTHATVTPPLMLAVASNRIPRMRPMASSSRAGPHQNLGSGRSSDRPGRNRLTPSEIGLPRWLELRSDHDWLR